MKGNDEKERERGGEGFVKRDGMVQEIVGIYISLSFLGWF